MLRGIGFWAMLAASLLVMCDRSGRADEREDFFETKFRSVLGRNLLSLSRRFEDVRSIANRFSRITARRWRVGASDCTGKPASEFAHQVIVAAGVILRSLLTPLTTCSRWPASPPKVLACPPRLY